MPVFREQEATSEVVDAPYSVIYDQAENRLHVQKAILSLMLGSMPSKI
jgi:ornithine carbamoyltransferase